MVGRDLRIAFLGDSFTAGVGDETALGWVGRVVARARSAGRNLTAYNLGVRRETSVDVLARLVAEAAPRLRDGDDHAVVLAVGANDTVVEAGQRRVALSVTLDALESVAAITAERAWALLVVGPPPVADDAHNDRIAELSAAMGETCARLGCAFAAVEAALRADVSWMREVAAGDGAHPGSGGYEQLADLIWPPFETWLTAIARCVP